MLSIDSALWRVRAYGDGYAHITQISTGAIRTVQRSTLPDHSTLAAVTESRFNAILREAFVNAAQG